MTGSQVAMAKPRYSASCSELDDAGYTSDHGLAVAASSFRQDDGGMKGAQCEKMRAARSCTVQWTLPVSVCNALDTTSVQ